MTKKPGSRVGLVLFDVPEQDVLVDLMVSKSTICEVQEFWTSLVLHNKEIVWSGQSPMDVVVLVDHRTQVKEIHSVIKGSSGEIERYNIDYSQQGITGVFFLRQQPERHPIFTQKWRFSYYFDNRRVIVESHPTAGLIVKTY